MLTQVGTFDLPIVPLWLFALGSPIHDTLVGYKAGVAEAGRAMRIDALAGALAEYLHDHLTCLVGLASRALVVPVPSSIGGRASWLGRHPLAVVWAKAITGAGPAVSDRLAVVELLGAGARPPRRLQASRSGFVPVDGACLDGQRVIAVDDVFTSGSRLLSAAVALEEAGAEVLAAVPLARLVRPEHNAASSAFWMSRRRRTADPTRCPVCGSPTRRFLYGNSSLVSRVDASLSPSPPMHRR